ncbi:MAG: ester cyclase [Anaerolineae bacterium]|nr:ester cyclase [Anaerolineae bacterium]
MSPEHNQRVLCQVIEEGFNKGNYDALDPLYAAGYREHQFDMSHTLEGFKHDIQYLRTAFPDLHLTIEDIVADGDKVWMRIMAHGTNQGYLFGPPTGKAMTITVFDTCRFEKGKIVEHWGVPDRFAQLAQLGLLPHGEGQKS